MSFKAVAHKLVHRNCRAKGSRKSFAPRRPLRVVRETRTTRRIPSHHCRPRPPRARGSPAKQALIGSRRVAAQTESAEIRRAPPAPRRRCERARRRKRESDDRLSRRSPLSRECAPLRSTERRAEGLSSLTLSLHVSRCDARTGSPRAERRSRREFRSRRRPPEPMTRGKRIPYQWRERGRFLLPGASRRRPRRGIDRDSGDTARFSPHHPLSRRAPTASAEVRAASRKHRPTEGVSPIVLTRTKCHHRQ
jgi:hypothetical protein